MLTLFRQYISQAALEIGYEWVKAYSQQALLTTKQPVYRPIAVQPPLIESRWTNVPIVHLKKPLEPQLERIQGVYQSGFIGICEAISNPQNRFIGFINGRCNSPQQFQNHALRIASYGLHVIGLYNPCIPGASKLVDYSQALKIFIPRAPAPPSITYLPEFIRLAVSLNQEKRFKVIAHSHGYALLGQSILYQGQFWSQYASQLELVGFAGVTSIPIVYNLKRVNFCNRGDWAVQLMLMAQKRFGDLELLPKPEEKGPYHRLWGPGYYPTLTQTLLA